MRNPSYIGAFSLKYKMEVMKNRIGNLIKIVIVIGIGIIGVFNLCTSKGETNSTIRNTPTHAKDTTTLVPGFMEESAKDGLAAALIYYDIQFPEIVYDQAILETGYFTSAICLKYHNLFGLYNSKAKDYYEFNHWSESVLAYKEWIQRRYKPPEDYYEFLQRIHYAEDTLYIMKLKQMKRK